MKKKPKKLSELQVTFNFVAEKYIQKFEKKHGYEFSSWVSDEVGGIACFIEQYFFSFDDIRYDIDNNVKKGLIFQWQDDGVENGAKDNINFRSYVMGARFPLVKDKDLIVLKKNSYMKIICFNENGDDMTKKVKDKFFDCKIEKKGDVFPNSLTELKESNNNYYQYFKIKIKENV
jgi:hypothetical protein